MVQPLKFGNWSVISSHTYWACDLSMPRLKWNHVNKRSTWRHRCSHHQLERYWPDLHMSFDLKTGHHDDSSINDHQGDWHALLCLTICTYFPRSLATYGRRWEVCIGQHWKRKSPLLRVNHKSVPWSWCQHVKSYIVRKVAHQLNAWERKSVRFGDLHTRFYIIQYVLKRLI